MAPYLFVLPPIILVGGIIVFPLLYSIYLSLHRYVLVGGRLVPRGMGNYIKLLSDFKFVDSLKLMGAFAGIAVPAELGIGMGVAVLLNRKLVGRSIIIPLLILPVMLIPIVSGLTFRFMAQPDVGLVNSLLRVLRIEGPTWLGEPSLAFLVIVVQDIWRMWGFMFLIIYANLISVPREYRDAAGMDGASSWRTFWSIIFPILKPAILIALLLRILDALRAFDEVWIMTKGGPGRATELVNIHLYKQSFDFFKLGYGAAASWIYTVMIVVVAIILVKSIFKAMEI